MDEVTSGLDEHTDEKLMVQFRSMADEQRKTIICVTHSLANVPDNCHQVVILARGGYLAFVGTPLEAMEYFKVQKLSEIYPMLVSTELDRDAPLNLAKRFRNSKHYQRYLDERLPEDQRVDAGEIEMAKMRKAKSPTRVNWFSESVSTTWQACILSVRHSLLLAKDRWHWMSLITQVLLIASVLYLAFETLGPMPAKPKYEDETLGIKAVAASDAKSEAKNNKVRDREKNRDAKEEDAPQERPVGFQKATMERMDWLRKVLNFTFLVGVTSFWLGCNNAAREIVRERAIYQQEKNFNLRPLAYFISKLLVLSLLVFCQVMLLGQLAWYFCGPPDSLTAYANVLITLAICGTTLGLMISSVSKTESVAVSLIPIAVIPQIILSGAITKLDGESGWGNVLAQLTVTNYWGRTWMDGCLTGDPSAFGLKKNIEMIEPSSVAFMPLLVIVIHSLLFCGVTMLSLYSIRLLPNIRWERQRP